MRLGFVLIDLIQAILYVQVGGNMYILTMKLGMSLQKFAHIFRLVHSI